MFLNQYFNLGRIVQTKRVADRRYDDHEFSLFVFNSLKRYCKNDWGEMQQMDLDLNDQSIVFEKIMSLYYVTPISEIEKNMMSVMLIKLQDADDDVCLSMLPEPDRVLASYRKDDMKIWIITEWDRSVTTVLFPEEY